MMSIFLQRVMKYIVACVVVLVALPVICHAGLFPEGKKAEKITNPSELTVIIPYDKEVDAILFTNINFTKERWGRTTRQEKITTFDKTAEEFKVERRTDNGTSGSGKIYTVIYMVKKKTESMEFNFKASSFETYQEGLILPFAVPEFSEEDLLKFIARQQLYLSLEINSQYNTESIYANFMRMAEKAPFYPGEKDPVTGKAYKDKFEMNSKFGKITFTLEAYPYRNGSKAVVHLSVPGTFTSRNTVDFREIINEIRSQLEAIVNS